MIFAMGLLTGVFAAVAFRVVRARTTRRLLFKFTSSVSHELRTPLAKILLYAETLELDRVKNLAGRSNAVRIIAQEARHLSYIVENVLLFSRAEQKPVTLETELVPLGPAIRTITEAFGQSTQARGAKLRLMGADGILVPLHHGALQQILLNLLENAAKYGPEAQTVVIRTELVPGRVRVIVDDEGPGIPRPDRERVWEPFVRLPASEGITGSGIGLAVVRDLVGAHGGRCWCESALAGGARVVIELPGAVVEAATSPILLDATR